MENKKHQVVTHASYVHWLAVTRILAVLLLHSLCNNMKTSKIHQD